jgi:DNA-binding MarR family transcriptional regulator
MHTQQLPADYALVLQQIGEDGSDGFDDLVGSLRLERSRLGHILQSLHHKGLIKIEHAAFGEEMWLSLSAKGRRLMTYLWPESGLQPSY